MLFKELFLFPEQDYTYSAILNEVACEVRIYYNQRMDSWILECKEEESGGIFLSTKLVPDYPIAIDYILPVNGFFVLLSKGRDNKHFYSDAFSLSKYYELYFVYPDEDGE